MMEVPTMDDTMEMASPYLGQADDFDIDIDLMEDHTSNMDSDMMGADEFSTTSQPHEPTNDAIFDADMADGPSEGSMVDVDNYVEEDNDIDVQFEERTYETEMTEGDQAENVDNGVLPAPIILAPGFGVVQDLDSAAIPDPINEERPVVEEQTVDVVPQVSSEQLESASAQNEVPEPGVDDPSNQNQVEPSTGDGNGSDEDDDDLADPPTGIVDFTEINSDHEKMEPNDEASQTVKPSVSNSEAKTASHENLPPKKEGAFAEEPSVENTTHTEAQSTSEVDRPVPGDAESHQESLHPVKIIYQENEIALFPPLEGDSAETFFLHDEDVAYENIEKLFKALRQVLQGNVADNEVLVIDVDALGIQMTEDSFHTSQVTLHQIIDLYLKLCRNDGANEPDALYLTMSSKRAFPAEIADLLDAANDGKALSELQPWDEYDEAEPGSEEDHDHEAEEHEDEAYYTIEAEQKLAVSEDQTVAVSEEQELLSGDPTQTQTQNEGEVQPDNVHSLDKQVPSSGEQDVEPVGEHEPRTDYHESNQPDQHQEFDQVHDDTNAERYESDAPQSESTATIVTSSGEADINEHNQDEQVQQVDGVDAEQHDDEKSHAEEPEYDELGPEEYEDGEIAPVDNSEPFQETGNDDVEAQQLASQPPISQREDGDDLDAAPSKEIAPVEPLQDEATASFPEQSAPTIDDGLQDVSDKKEQTPEPTNDLLGIAVDVMQTPPKDTEHNSVDHFEGLDYDDHDDEFAVSAAPDNEDADNQEFDVNEFGDYDANFAESEAVELVGTDPSLADSQPHDNASTKRSRDEEDDWDVVDTTLDNKRRRSS